MNKPKKKKQCWVYNVDTSNLNNLNMNSWFQSKYLLNGNSANITFNKSKENVMRCHKVYIFPTDEQKDILETWFNSYCFVYNQTVKYIRQTPNFSFIKLRPIIWNLLSKEQTDFIKKIKVPRHTLDNAIKDVVKAYKSAFANHRKFRIRFKKQKSPRQTLTLEASAFSKNKNTFCASVFKQMQTSESIIGIKHDCRLTYNRTKGTYVLNVPFKKGKTCIKGRRKAIALDPGIRDFQTGYSDSGIYYFGKDTRNNLEKLHKQLDNIRSKRMNYRMKKAEIKRNDKIKNLVNDLHYKTADYLCSNFRTIMIGKISIQSVMSNKNKCKLAAMTKRLGYSLSHFIFRQRLKDRCEETGTKYIEVDERYTSKTCSRCENVKQNLGGSRVYQCNNCNLLINRDVNAAINIYKRGAGG